MVRAGAASDRPTEQPSNTIKLWGAGPQGGFANRIRWLGGSLERGVLVQRVWRNNAARDQTGWYDDSNFNDVDPPEHPEHDSKIIIFDLRGPLAASRASRKPSGGLQEASGELFLSKAMLPEPPTLVKYVPLSL